MTEPIHDALGKLYREAQCMGGYGGVPTLPIYHHLREAVEQSEELAAAVMKEGKTLKGCFDYVLKQMENRVLERTGKQSVCATEEDTYNVSEDYWRKSDADIKTEQEAADAAFKLAQEKKRVADDIKRKEEDAKRKAEAKTKKKADKEKKADTEEVPAEESAPGEDEAGEDEVPAPPPEPEAEQLSMFD